MKYDSSGLPLRASTYPKSLDSPFINIDSKGYIYLVANYFSEEPVVLNNSLTLPANGSNGDMLIIKMANDFTAKWFQTVSGDNWETYMSNVTFDTLDDVYIAGSYKRATSTIEFDGDVSLPPTTNASGYQSFVVKYNSNGLIQFAKTVSTSGTGGMWNSTMTLDSKGNLYTGGSYGSTVNVVFSGGASLPPTSQSLVYINKMTDIFEKDKMHIKDGDIRLNGTGTVSIQNKHDTSDYGSLELSSGYRGGSSRPKISIVGYTGASTVNGDNLIKFHTGGSQRMIVNQSGNVGVGTTNPHTKLHVLNAEDNTGTGDGFISGLTANTDNRKPSECLRLQGQWRSPGSGGLLRFTNTHGGGTNPNTGEYNLAGIAGIDYDNNWGGALCFYTSRGDQTGGNNLEPRMLIDNAGNVGVGTTSPDCNLEIYGDTPTIKVTRSRNNTNYGTNISFALLNSANEKFTYGRIGGSIADNTDGSEDGLLSFQVATNGNLRSNYEEEKMRILSNGNVGIGTKSPESTLHVNGNAIIGDIGVTTGLGHTDAQLILAGTHNTNYNNGDKIKLLISGGNNDGPSPYDIMCEDENGNDNFWLKGPISEGGNDGVMYMKGKIGIRTSSPARALDVHAAARPSGYPFSIGGTWSNRSNYIAVEVNPSNNQTSFYKDFLMGGHSRPIWVRVHYAGSGSGDGTLQQTGYAEFTVSLYGTNTYASRRAGDAHISIARNGVHNGFRVTMGSGQNMSYPRAWIEVYSETGVYF
jgi:hypothetical protein